MRTPAAHPDRLTAEERRELDDDAFGIPSRREFPLVDAAHVRAAESYFRYAPEADKPALAWRRMRQAAEFGIEIRSETILRWEVNRYCERPGQFTDYGCYTVRGNILTLRPDSPKDIPAYYRVGENRLWRLDSHQQPITGPFADQYILTKSDSATPAGCY